MVVLIVDDHPQESKLLTRELTVDGYQVKVIDKADMIWINISVHEPDLVLLNCIPDKFESFELLVNIKEVYPHLPVLVYIINSIDALVDLKETVNFLLQ